MEKKCWFPTAGFIQPQISSAPFPQKNPNQYLWVCRAAHLLLLSWETCIQLHNISFKPASHTVDNPPISCSLAELGSGCRYLRQQFLEDKGRSRLAGIPARPSGIRGGSRGACFCALHPCLGRWSLQAVQRGILSPPRNALTPSFYAENWKRVVKCT